MTGALLAEAMETHPLRDTKCWGVRVCNFASESGRKYYSYATSPQSYTFGRIPAGVDLKEAVACYMSAAATWKDVWLTRSHDINGTMATYENGGALAYAGFMQSAAQSTEHLHERLRAKGARLPASIALPGSAYSNRPANPYAIN